VACLRLWHPYIAGQRVSDSGIILGRHIEVTGVSWYSVTGYTLTSGGITERINMSNPMLVVDEYYGNGKRIYWEGSPGVHVFEGPTAKPLCEYLNSLPDKKRDAHFCPLCGKFLYLIVLEYRRQKQFVMGKKGYEWQAYPVNIFHCGECDRELDDDALELMGMVL